MANKAKEPHLSKQSSYDNDWQQIWMKFIEASQQSLKTFIPQLPSQPEQEKLLSLLAAATPHHVFV